MDFYYCKSTAQGKSVEAKNPKMAAELFINEMLRNCYKFKLKKVSEASAKAQPDYSVSVNKSGEQKIYYFQYTSLKPKR